MPKVRLVHWRPEEAAAWVRILEQEGFEVTADPPAGSSFLRELEAEEPAVVIIDLSRNPSQGRDLGIAIRMRRGTRTIPLLFVAGEPAKVERVRDLLPDAEFAPWDEVVAAIPRAMERQTGEVVVPESAFAAYRGTPLPQKLGIKPSSLVSVVNAPAELAAALGKLPPGAALVAGLQEGADLALWFLRSADELRDDLRKIVETSQWAPVWIAWPKKGSNVSSDLTQQTVREIAMNAGMVDYKVCSIDRTWSALLFTWRGFND